MGEDYYNELLIKYNMMEAEFDSKFKFLLELDCWETTIKNPVSLAKAALISLKELGDWVGFDIFGDDSYIKYIYVVYFEDLVNDIMQIAAAISNFVTKGVGYRLLHRKEFNTYVDAFKTNYNLLDIFVPDNVLSIYSLMLQEQGDFDYFKPGMFYIFTNLILDDYGSLGFNLSDDIFYDESMRLVVKKEKVLEKNIKGVDFDTFDPHLEMISKKYRVNFASLLDSYTFEIKRKPE